MKKRAKFYLYSGRVYYLALFALLGVHQPAASTESKHAACQVELRNNFSGGDVYFHRDGRAYLLTQYRDGRFDDMTEVHKLNSCDKIASGVSKDSPFSATLAGKGFVSKQLISNIDAFTFHQLNEHQMLAIKSRDKSHVKFWITSYLDRDQLPQEVRLGLLDHCQIKWDENSPRDHFVSNLSSLRQSENLCLKEVTETSLALLQFDQKSQRAELALAISWKKLESFVEKFKSNDVAKILAEAEAKLVLQKKTEIDNMLELSMPDLENFFYIGDRELTSEMLALVRQRLVDESLRENTFSGAQRAYRVTKDVSFIIRAQQLAQTTADKRVLEQLAVQLIKAPSRFFNIDINTSIGRDSQNEQKHAGVFALYTMYGYLPIDCKVALTPAPNSPVSLTHSEYKITIELTLSYDVQFYRRSRFLGSVDQKNRQESKKQLTIIWKPNATKALETTNFALQSVMFKRGSSGGFDQEYIASDPVLDWKIIKMEAIN